MQFSVYLFLNLFLCVIFVCDCTEPSCSNFDYEEKLQAKTIRLELTVEDLAKTVGHVQDGLTSCENSRKEMEVELADLKTEVENLTIVVTELESNARESTPQPTAKANTTSACQAPYLYNSELKLCWRLETEKRTSWFKAWLQCSSEGAHLIILDTAAKRAFIKKSLTNVSIPGNYVFVGGEDMTEEGKFRWINGEPVKGIPWQSGQPNNANGNDHCLTMYKPNSFTFYDTPCTSNYNFLCQKN